MKTNLDGSQFVSAPTGIVPMLDAQVKLLADQYYHGIRLDPSSTDPAHPGKPSVTPVCSLYPNTLNKNTVEGDGTNNYLGASCGLPLGVKGVWSYPTCTGKGHYGGCPDSGATIDCDDNCVKACIATGIANSPPTITVDYGVVGARRGDLESSWTRGLWVQDLYCHYKEVLQEISTNNGLLNVSPSCASLGANIGTLIGNASASAGQITDAFKATLGDRSSNGPSYDPQDLWKCDLSTTQQAGSSDKRDFQVRQRAQQLCAVRFLLEGLFSQLAMCEITARTDDAFNKLNNSPPQAIMNNLKNKFTDGTFVSLCNITDSDIKSNCDHDCKHHCNYDEYHSCTVASGTSGCHGVDGMDGPGCSACVNTLANGDGSVGNPGKLNPCYYSKILVPYMKTLYDLWDWDHNGGVCKPPPSPGGGGS